VRSTHDVVNESFQPIQCCDALSTWQECDSGGETFGVREEDEAMRNGSSNEFYIIILLRSIRLFADQVTGVPILQDVTCLPHLCGASVSTMLTLYCALQYITVRRTQPRDSTFVRWLEDWLSTSRRSLYKQTSENRSRRIQEWSGSQIFMFKCLTIVTQLT